MKNTHLKINSKIMHSFRDTHDIWSHEIKIPNHIIDSNNYFVISYILIVTIYCCFLKIK